VDEAGCDRALACTEGEVHAIDVPLKHKMNRSRIAVLQYEIL
jgi:hypothetical protein